MNLPNGWSIQKFPTGDALALVRPNGSSLVVAPSLNVELQYLFELCTALQAAVERSSKPEAVVEIPASTQPDDNEPMRKVFELDYRKRHDYDLKFTMYRRDHGGRAGEYTNQHQQISWESWQACMAHQSYAVYGWMIIGKATTLFRGSPAKPSPTLINGFDPVIELIPLYRRGVTPDLTPGSAFMVEMDSVLRHVESFDHGQIDTGVIRELVLQHQAIALKKT